MKTSVFVYFIYICFSTFSIKEKNLCDFRLLSEYHESQSNGKLNFIKIKTIFSLGDIIKVKRQAMDWENIYKYSSKKGLY